MSLQADHPPGGPSQLSIAGATARDSRRLAVVIWTAVILTCLGLLGPTAWLTWQSRERALEAARREAGDTARLLEGQVAAIVDAAELIINGVGRELKGDARDKAAQARAAYFLAALTARQSRAGALAAVREVRVLDLATNALEFSASLTGQPVSDARASSKVDAEAAEAHRGGESLGLHVGVPVSLEPPTVGEGPDAWLLGLSRRAEGVEGSRSLVVVVQLSLDRLQQLFARAGDLGPSGFVQLLRIDGRLLVREPYSRPALGRDLSGAPLFSEHLGRAAAGDYGNVGPVDGVRRLISYRRVPGSPLVLTVSAAERDALADWRRDALGNGGLALAAAFSIAVLGGWLAWEAKRRARAKGKLAEQARVLASTLENMDQGLLMVDANDIVQICNSRAATLLDLPADLIARKPRFRDILQFQVERGEFDEDEADVVRQAIAAGGGVTNTRQIYDRVRPDGTVLEIRTVSLEGGGAVRTYTDVTARRAVKAALLDQNRRFDAALANMAHGLCMFDADARLVVRNDRYLEIAELTAADVPLGIPERAILERLVSLGRYASAISIDAIQEETRLKLANRDSSPALRRTADGRTIAISHRAMTGGGWVATVEDVTEREKAAEQLAHMARHDALTELPNRVEFRERIEVALGRRRDGDGLPVLCLDLDRFKAVNDTLGHPVGDALLRAVADRVREVLGPRGVVARLGGDEFAVLQEASGRDDAASLGARLVEALGEPFEVDGHQIVVGASVGVAVAPEDGDAPDILLRHADMALYRAKADGRGVFRAFEPAMTAWAQARRALEVDLRGAMSRDEFALDYQPLVTLAEEAGHVADRVTGFEALLRWTHPERGAVPPGIFVPVAEEIGLIAPLGEWALRRACADAARHWPEPVGVAVNLSAVQFRRGQDLAETVFAALGSSGLRPGRLELEITESILLEHTETTLATLHRLRSFGVRIALDDFGTGYSSLGYLRRFPFDKIKIDRSFVGEIGVGSDEGRTADGDAATIVRAVAALGASLGMTTTAEGVETEAQLAAVRAGGCTEAQGYLFGRPRPLADAWPPASALNGVGRRAA